jgi:hypothetical protein
MVELATRLDDALTFCLAIHFGRESEHVLSLLRDVFWRLPIEMRIGLLEEALWRTGLHDEVPFLVARMKAVFRVRNSLAHSVTYGSTDTHLMLRSVKRGKPELSGLSADHLNWAVFAAEICELNFLRIEGRIGGIDAWADVYGFAER